MSKILVMSVVALSFIVASSDAFAQKKQSVGPHCQPGETGHRHPNKADCFALCKKRSTASTIARCQNWCEKNCSR